jgi:hypothetical protein
VRPCLRALLVAAHDRGITCEKGDRDAEALRERCADDDASAAELVQPHRAAAVRAEDTKRLRVVDDESAAE